MNKSHFVHFAEGTVLGMTSSGGEEWEVADYYKKNTTFPLEINRTLKAETVYEERQFSDW